jgi:hypothetical protein
MAIGTALAIGAGVAAIGSAASAVGAHQDKQRAKGEKARAEAELEAIKKSRQEITNPYAGVEDLSGQMTNPFEYLGVATQAAEIKMEQSDIALANTLDTLAATGASAGGATALAQAALQSKKDIAASIEQQEAQNEKLRAQGEQSLNAQRIAEQQRVQSLEAAGEQFMFQAQENRTNADLDRAAGMITQAQQNIAQANQAKASSIMGGVGAVGSIGAAVAANPNFGLE